MMLSNAEVVTQVYEDTDVSAPGAVRQQALRVSRQQLDKVYVSGAHIRFVHFPEDIPIARHLVAIDRSKQQVKQLYERGKRKRR